MSLWKSTALVRDTYSKIHPNGKISSPCPTFSWFFHLFKNVSHPSVHNDTHYSFDILFQNWSFLSWPFKIPSKFQIIFNVNITSFSIFLWLLTLNVFIICCFLIWHRLHCVSLLYFSLGNDNLIYMIQSITIL